MGINAILSAAGFQQLVEESPDAMFVTRRARDAVILYVNPRMVQLLGYDSPDELVGRPGKETLVHPDDVGELLRRLASDPVAGPRTPLELRWRRRDGGIVHVQTISTDLEFDHEPAMLITARDMGEHVRRDRERDVTEAALRLAEERNRALFDLTPLPIWVFDRDTLEYLAVNEALLATYGYTRDEFLAMRLSDVKFTEDVPQLVTHMSAMASGTILRVGVVRHRHKDGHLIELDITSQGIEFEGRPAMLAIGVDVTESRKLEDQLRQSQKMEAIGQLAGGVAHDFNNILGVILANAELATESHDQQLPIHEEIHEIRAAAERAAALTRQLLAFSRQQPRKTSTVALNGVVTNLEKMLCRIVGEDIAMTAMLAPNLGSIDADVAQLEQILVNLVVNARDAMPKGGKLALATENVQVDPTTAARIGVAPGRYVTLAVSDTGTGMDAATQARIFEPFFTTKEVGKGTGLGLSTVFGIVKQSGGAIALTSEVGRGTTFRVYLPRIAGTIEISRVGERPVERGTETVLVVEDDPMLRSVIRRHLRALGYSSLEAANGSDALELLDTNATPIDLMLTDVVMPGLDGRTLAGKAAQLRPDMRVLFMSGYTEHASVVTMKVDDDDHFVEKPFTSAKLSHAIRRALEAG